MDTSTTGFIPHRPYGFIRLQSCGFTSSILHFRCSEHASCSCSGRSVPIPGLRVWPAALRGGALLRSPARPGGPPPQDGWRQGQHPRLQPRLRSGAASHSQGLLLGQCLSYMHEIPLPYDLMNSSSASNPNEEYEYPAFWKPQGFELDVLD